MNKDFLLFFLLLFFSWHGKAQSRDISEELRFVSYLIDNAEYRDALFIINHLPAEEAEGLQKDSLNYYAGWAFYSLKKLDSSAYWFSKVSPESVFYLQSKFYEAFDYIYLGKYDIAKTVLNNMAVPADTAIIKLKNFEMAGIALLERDYQKFTEISLSFDSGYYPIAAEEANFIKYNRDLQAIRLKSAFLAGLFSAFIPGSGKFYAGYRGQAIAAFLPTALLAAVAVESLLKAGLRSPQFIIFSGLFSVFYIGNIWGSALSVKTRQYEQGFEIDQNILLDLHLPLRRVFN